MRIVSGIIGVLAFAAAGQGAYAGPCDYRPSKMVAGAASAVGEQVKAVGAFALTNAATGGSLIGTSAATAGASGTAAASTAAAGTAAGSGTTATTAAGSAHGALGAALSGSASVVVAAAAAVGLAGYEGLCYFSDRKVTKYNEILGVMRNLAANADPAVFSLNEGSPKKQDATITVQDETGKPVSFPVSKLYIENNKLMFSKMGRDEVVGNIDFVPKETEPVAAPDATPADAATPDAAAPSLATQPPAASDAGTPAATSSDAPAQP